MILHTVNKSHLSSDCLDSCLRTLAPKDSLLLIEDGVYSADQHFEAVFKNLSEGVSLFVLKADIEARGLQQRLSDRFKVIDDSEFVELTIQNPKMQSWY